jgi:POT family proton-dependent oligopeptide transporter
MSQQWFGHPRGLSVLFFTEMWERFSFTGMRTLLFLYMVGSVQQPGLGFSAREAGTIYGTYTMLVFVSGMAGGWIADRWLGQYRAVLIGGIIIAAGHFSMAAPGLPFFYTGLALIVIGTGLLKPSVSTMVGNLYAPEDKRRDAGFAIFYMGINTGGVLAIVCAWLGQKGSWHLGFAAAGVGMILGLIQYVVGRKHLAVDERPHPASGHPLPEAGEGPRDDGCREPSPAWREKVPLTLSEAKRKGRMRATSVTQRIAAIVILSLFALLFWAAFAQIGTTLTLFADRATRLTIAGFGYPSSAFQSANPFFIIVFSPLIALLWMRLGKREPSSPTKFTLGLALHAVAFAILLPAAFEFESTNIRVSPLWLIAFYLVQAIAELCLSPVGLSLVARLAPARTANLMMGVWFFATGMGSFVAGWIARYLEKGTYSNLFLITMAVMAISAVLLAAIGKPIRRLTGE